MKNISSSQIKWPNTLTRAFSFKFIERLTVMPKSQNSTLESSFSFLPYLSLIFSLSHSLVEVKNMISKT